MLFRSLNPTFRYSIFLIENINYDEVWISSVERAQLSSIPLLEDTTSSCMVTGVVLATMPPMLKLGIKECNMLK